MQFPFLNFHMHIWPSTISNKKKKKKNKQQVEYVILIITFRACSCVVQYVFVLLDGCA
jgi:hypothetical protein